MNFKIWFETIQAPRRLPQDKLSGLAMLMQQKIPYIIKLDWDGGFLSVNFKDSPQKQYTCIDVNKKIIYPEHEFEYHPLAASLLSQLYQTHLFDDYTAATQYQQLPFGELVKQIKNVKGVFPTFAKQNNSHKSVVKPFGLQTFKELYERPWYHTTFYKYLKKIFKQGLQPSKTFDEILDKYADETGGIPLDKIPKVGWSVGPNFERQAAVYLFMDKNNAINLAKYLSYRNQQSTVVIKVAGEVLKDYAKLTPDEDQFRDAMDGSINKFGRTSMPHFYQSVLGIRTIAYKGVIHPKFLSVAEKIKPEQFDEDDY